MKGGELNLNQPDFFQNPYPFYEEIRANQAPFWLAHNQKTSSAGVWLFGGYEEAVAIFKETTAISKNLRAVRPAGTSTPFDLAMLHQDAPDHLRLRRLVSGYFSAGFLKRLEPRVNAIANELLAALSKQPDIDMVRDFAEQLPLRVIGELIGLPPTDLAQVRAWSVLLGDGFDSVMATDEVLARQRDALTAYLAYIEALLARPKRIPDGSLLSDLIVSEAKGELSREELIGMVSFLLFAGHETTINLIGNGLWLLLSHPDQLKMLKRDPALLPGAIEEILRFESPEQRTSFRIAVEPIEVAGVRLEKGQQLGVIIGSANRDASVFDNPDVFDIRRTPNRHLAFGLGLHHCLGAQLSRMEAKVAFQQVLRHFPSLQLATGGVTWRQNSFFRGLEALPVWAASGARLFK
jgi:cytochrome P450